MACVTSGASGATLGSKRLTIRPSRPIRNFPKFHFTSPGKGESLPDNAAYNGCCSGPFTCSLSNIGNVTLYFVEQNSLISSLVPGSWEPKSLDGNPSTLNPLSLYF